ncbi:MAG: hypothetical protein L6420_04880 [Elusimicrobia bacterium]|nr:hypothetical protein [Elusimicrobiota bacterium]
MIKNILLSLVVIFIFTAFSNAVDKDKFLMGSIVKSKSWKIDRKNNKEIFKGDVSFKNQYYDLKSDYAEYDHKTKYWDLNGNVYCQRFFQNKTSIELNCERGVFFEEFENAALYKGTNPIKTVYFSNDGRTLSSYCDEVNIDNKTNRIDFKNNFILETQKSHAYSANALYDNNKDIFTLSGSKPVVVGMEKGYNFAIQGDILKFYKDKNDIEVLGRAKGWADISNIKR